MLFAHPLKNFLPAKRIISLIPSVTEWLYRLGLTKETIAITFFCIHPAEWYKTKVIADKEENIKEQVEAIALHAPVY